MDTIKKRYYTIGEIKKSCEVSHTWIYEICKEYGIEPMRRRGTRVFTAEQAEEIAIILETQKIRRADALKALLYMRYPKRFKRFRRNMVDV